MSTGSDNEKHESTDIPSEPELSSDSKQAGTTAEQSNDLCQASLQHTDNCPASDTSPASTISFMDDPSSERGSFDYNGSHLAHAASPPLGRYAHTFHNQIPFTGYTYHQWSPESAAYAYTFIPHPLDVSSQPDMNLGRGLSLHQGILPVNHMGPFLTNSGPHTIVPILASSWNGKPKAASASKNYFGKNHQSNINLLGKEIPTKILDISSSTATGMYRAPVSRNTNSVQVMALAQVAEQAALQSSLKYGNMSAPSSPISPSSPTRIYHELEPDVLSKASQGPPIPPPVPSLFVAPTFEDALESSLYNPNNTKNVYIRGLPPDTTDDSLIEICARFGEIASSKAIIDAQTNSCKGFGFACFVHETDATSCIAGLIHYGYQVSFAKESFSTRLKNLQDPESTNLYLSNMPLDMHEKVRPFYI